MILFRTLAVLALAIVAAAACGPTRSGADPLRRPTPREWAARFPVSKACEELVATRRATPLADGDTMPQPQYMDVGSSGTPGMSGSARFVVTELGIVDTATITVDTRPELTEEPRAKLVEALREWRLVPARENGCWVAGWFSYLWANE